ncbi:hypothetical protein Peur_008910 [Populus x canadensis]
MDGDWRAQWKFLNSLKIFINSIIVLSTVVTLDSMKIYRTQEWLNAKPTIYFSCKGENITALPDVKQVNVCYTFEESWQMNFTRLQQNCSMLGSVEPCL